MSVVRKYQVGGSSPNPNKYSGLADYLRKKLEETSFTAKAEPLARGVASDWASLASAGNLDEIYSYDPITQNYTVNTEKIADQSLKGKDWAGSKDSIKTNVFGQYTAQMDKSNKGEIGEDLERRKFNSLMANWTSEYMNQQKSPESTPSFSGTKKIGDYSSFYDQAYYGGKGDFEDQWTADMLKIASMDDRKKKIMSHAPEFLSTWKDPSKRLSNWKYEDVANEQALIDAAQSGNWDAFTTEAKKIGWRPEDLLREKSQEQIDAEKAAQQSKDIISFQNDLLGKGYSQEMINEMIGGGYTKFGTFNGPQWVTEDIAKNALVLTNPTNNKTIIINKSGFYNPIYADPDSYEGKSYGTYLQHKEGQASYYDPTIEGYDKALFNDPYKHSNYRPLEGTVSEYPDWELYGVPKVSGGGERYIDKLILKDPVSKKTIEVIKEGNSYKTLDGKPLTVDIKAYGTGQSSLDATHLKPLGGEYNDIFEQIKEVKPLEPTQNIISNAKDILSKGVDREFDENMFEYLKKLKWVSKNDPSVIWRDEAASLYNNVIKSILESPNVKDKDNLIELINIGGSDIANSAAKSGIFGTLRGLHLFQKGGKVEDYLEKYRRKAPGEENTTSEPLKDRRGTLSDANTLDYVSMAGAAASIIPGIGAIGAGVSTIADLANDITDNGKIDNWGTHAMNAGFIGLSAVGLGGLKTAQAGYKAAKMAKIAGLSTMQAEKVAKLARINTLAKATGVTLPTITTTNAAGKAITTTLIKNTSALESGIAKLATAEKVSTFGKAGLAKEEISALKQLGIIKRGANSNTRISNKILKGVDDIKAMKPKTPSVATPKAPNLLEREFSGTIDLLKGANPNWAKVGKVAGNAYKGAGLVTGGLSAARAGMGAVTEGAEGVNVQDLKGGLYLAGGLRGVMKSSQLAKKMLDPKLYTKGNSTPGTVQIGGAKPISLKETLTLPKTKFYQGKKASEEALKNFKEQAKTAVGDEEIFKQHFEGLKDLKGIKITAPKEDLGSLMKQKKSGLSKVEYDRIKAALDGKVGSYFLPSWYKKGGVLKLANGGSAATGFKGINLDKIKSLINVDSTDFLNVLNYGQVKRANAEATRLEKQALEKSITKAPAAPKEYLRIANTTKPFYDKQANDVNMMAKRIANSTSDLNASANIRFEGANRARQATEAGIGVGQQEIQQGIERQQQSNRQTQLSNLETDYKNKLMANDAISRMFLSDRNKAVADSTAKQNLLLAFGHNKQLKDQKLKYGEYYKALTDPNREIKIKEYEQLNDSLTKGKIKWEEEKGKMGLTSSTWEESPEYKTITDRLKKLSEELLGYQKNVQNLGFSLQMPGRIGYNPTFAKGGSITEKKEMLRYADELRRANKDTERVFKAILQSNELMQKSLIKIFK